MPAVMTKQRLCCITHMLARCVSHETALGLMLALGAQDFIGQHSNPNISYGAFHYWPVRMALQLHHPCRVTPNLR